MFRWVAEQLGLLSKRPAHVPDCYPEFSFAELCQILPDPVLDAVRDYQLVCVMPLVREASDKAEAALGLSLSQILIRNLMLVPELSVRGFEDVPLLNYEGVTNPDDFSFTDTTMIVGFLELTDKIELHLTIHQTLQSRVSSPQHPAQSSVTEIGAPSASLGIEQSRNDQIAADLEISQYGPEKRLYLTATSIDSLVLNATRAICGVLGVPEADYKDGLWTHGLPPDLDTMLIHGALRALFSHDEYEAHQLAVKLTEESPDFALPLHYLDPILPETPELLIRGLNRDPYDPQLCYHLFRALWKNQGPDRQAFQFLRRALELCPGHGKSHMFAAHAGAESQSMLRYAELGYRLLPDSSMAVSSYLSYLQRAESLTPDAIPLVIENIDRDPFNPRAYWQAIEILASLKQYSIAIDTSQKLLRLLQPPINPHTLQFIGPASFDGQADSLFQLTQRVQSRLSVLRQLHQDQSDFLQFD